MLVCRGAGKKKKKEGRKKGRKKERKKREGKNQWKLVFKSFKGSHLVHIYYCTQISIFYVFVLAGSYFLKI